MEHLAEALGLTQTLELLSLSPPGWGGNLLRGLANSLKIAFGAFGFGLVLGLLGGLILQQALADLLAIYTTVVRAVPELVLILILYYVGTDLINQAAAAMGYGRVEISGVAAGIWVLGVVQGAYATEILRGAILAVPPGQIEAARAFGMPPLMTMRRVTIPAMLSFALPGLANLWLVLLKETSLVSIIALNDLLRQTSVAVGATKEPFFFYLVACLIYLAMSIISTFGLVAIERWSERGMKR